MEETTLKIVLVEQRTETNEKLNYNGKNNISSNRKIYMDYNATTPLAPEVIETVKEAMYEAWGNPSSSYEAGQRAKKIINEARESLAKMVGGRFQDIIFTSGGTEANNLVIHTAVKDFMKSSKQSIVATRENHEEKTLGTLPHIIISCIEHDSVRLPVEHLVKEQKAGEQLTILFSQPISELSQRIEVINHKRKASGLPWILVHTDAAQMIGKGRVDVQDLGVDYLTIVGHKFYAPRIGALYVRGLGMNTPLHPMLFGGGQEWSFRPGTENTPMIAGLGKAAELVNENSELYEAHMRKVRDYLEKRLETIFGRQNIHFNCRLEGSKRLCNTCNFSILGPGLQGWLVLSRCRSLLASVGAACHSEKGDEPSAVLLSCGIPYNVAQNAIRLSVGRNTSKEDVDLIVEDLKQAVAELQ
ncbi:selenocysteine lyase [Protobothrops mucrosquamatus]|uniref:selenocysteine lyase n=1 Tax=Protobothrops mucrosquamatus TaxID=103944 RepID=UPI000775D0A7|nr:selenocysteine lyase [Protobothrops mucrosquamatus]